jgi:hypothetical protein
MKSYNESSGKYILNYGFDSKICVVALTIKATASMSGIIDQFTCIAERSINIYDGSGTGVAEWAGAAYSQNPAAIALDMLRGDANSDPVPDSMIDWPSFEAWYTSCATNGWTCNAVIANGQMLRDTLSQVARAGRAVVMLQYGKYTVVADVAKTTTVQLFNPRNTSNFSWAKSFNDKSHALRINFIDEDSGYTVTERLVYADGYTSANATIIRHVNLFGVTDSDLVWKHGRYMLAVEQLRPEVYMLETDAESIVSDPGDKVLVAHDALVVSVISGRIKAVTVDGSSNVTGCLIDELVTFEAGTTYALRIRINDGTIVYGTANNAAGYYGSLITFASPIAAATAPATGDLYTFGEYEAETLECIVLAKESMQDGKYRVTLTAEAPGVHTADSGAIPAYEANITKIPVIDASPGVPTPATQAVIR